MSSARPCRVFVCIDHSSNSEKAFDFYCKFLKRKDHEVTLLHVSECITIPVMDYVTVELEKEAERIKASNESLKTKYDEICKLNDVKHKTIIAAGEDGILNVIQANMKKYEPDMIVMGSRGLGTIRRTLLGSVSDYIIHHTHIPVFICPP